MWLYQLEGYPRRNDIVLCEVDKIEYHSVFVNLIEYRGLKGLIKISEVSPGRIRNIRDYVKEKSIVVCKVLYINYDNGLIELSLRKVNQREKREKINEMKEEQLAEKIISNVAKKLDKKTEDVYKEVFTKLTKEFSTLFEAFQGYVDKTVDLDKYGIDSKVVRVLKDELTRTLSPTKVVLKGKYYISSYDSEGVNIITHAFREASNKEVTAKYEGGGTYLITLESKDFKTGEKILNDYRQPLEENLKNKNTFVDFERV
ncbi:MAG: hypothetical protein GWP09_00115 [Nitrospiraceae bacterium]|nr:hypothetical protein [Nitrospiraceae bacterium]